MKILLLFLSLFVMTVSNGQTKSKCTYNISHKVLPVYSNSSTITKAEVYIEVDCSKYGDANVIIDFFNNKGEWQTQATKTIVGGKGMIKRKPTGLKIGEIAKYRYYFYPKSDKVIYKDLKDKDFEDYEFEITKILRE
jgi:hypothetical protein